LLLSIVMPVLDTPAPILREAIASVRAQSHQAWELCIADDASSAAHIPIMLADAAAGDDRIKIVRLDRQTGIAAASNAALALATGEFMAFLDHDDTLAPDALARFAAELANNPLLDMLFSDEDQLDEGGQCVSPYFKPGWNPDLLLGQNFVCHLACYRRSLIVELGGMREGLEGSQDFDLALRAATVTPARRIRHVAGVLYHWRRSAGSYSTARALACQETARLALSEHLHGHASVLPNQAAPQWFDAVFRLPEKHPLVSIVFSGQHRSLRDPLYKNVEVIVSGRRSNAESARGTVLIFAGNITAEEPGWVGALVANALRPGVGCVGARIDDSSGRLVHAGYVLDEARIAQTLSPGSDAEDPGYRGHFCLMRTVSAVSDACFAIRRDIFLDAGGFDGRAGAYADIDLALRLAEKNLRCVWVPLARVRARGRLLPQDDPAGAAYMRERWQEALSVDRYFNPLLTIRHGQLALRSSLPERQMA
jgi:glycosyltransferase involved in cell wall biosynthesis